MHVDQVRIADPCHADWDAMSGDARKRFCGSCTKHVHDLSAMTEREARSLLASGTNVCVRYAADPDGRIRHATRIPRLVALGAALLGGGPAFASGAVQPTEAAEPTLLERVVRRVQHAVGYAPTAGEEPAERPLPREVPTMGEVAAPPPPPPPPRMLMGRPAPIPTIRLPAPARIPEPPPGASVIPEVEQALEAQRQDPAAIGAR